MDHLDSHIAKRKRNSKYLSSNFERGYQDFKIGAMCKLAREESGFTQEEIAIKLKTEKSAISRIENHAEDIKLSTIEKFVFAVGKELKLQVV